MVKPITVIDLFCGAGGTSTGILHAAESLGRTVRLTVVNHDPQAIQTHSRNHPSVRHECASVDSIRPEDIGTRGALDAAWFSPECIFFSRARTGRPVNDQRRSTAWCVTRYAEALLPKVIWVENVVEFLDWAPCNDKGYPIKSRKGEIFRAWVSVLRSLGYEVEWRVLTASDYGAPTSRKRLIIQAVRQPARIVWPSATHADPDQETGLPRHLKPYCTARQIIDWSIPGTSIVRRARPLCKNTLSRVMDGFRQFAGSPFIVAWDNQSSASGCWSIDKPLPTVVTKARFGLVDPQPFLVKYYGTGAAVSVDKPLDTVTTRDRFGLVQPVRLNDGSPGVFDANFRILNPGELARAQGFPADYEFPDNKEAAVRQIGNAVPVQLSEALMRAQIMAGHL